MNDLGFLVQDSYKFSVNTKIGNKLINIQLSYLIQEGDCAPRDRVAWTKSNRFLAVA